MRAPVSRLCFFCFFPLYYNPYVISIPSLFLFIYFQASGCSFSAGGADVVCADFACRGAPGRSKLPNDLQNIVSSLGGAATVSCIVNEPSGVKPNPVGLLKGPRLPKDREGIVCSLGGGQPRCAL